jgi:hypothetical protein
MSCFIITNFAIFCVFPQSVSSYPWIELMMKIFTVVFVQGDLELYGNSISFESPCRRERGTGIIGDLFRLNIFKLNSYSRRRQNDFFWALELKFTIIVYSHNFPKRQRPSERRSKFQATTNASPSSPSHFLTQQKMKLFEMLYSYLCRWRRGRRQKREVKILEKRHRGICALEWERERIHNLKVFTYLSNFRNSILAKERDDGDEMERSKYNKKWILYYSWNERLASWRERIRRKYININNVLSCSINYVFWLHPYLFFYFLVCLQWKGT